MLEEVLKMGKGDGKGDRRGRHKCGTASAVRPSMGVRKLEDHENMQQKEDDRKKERGDTRTEGKGGQGYVELFDYTREGFIIVLGKERSH